MDGGLEGEQRVRREGLDKMEEMRVQTSSVVARVERETKGRPSRRYQLNKTLKDG